MNLVEQIAGVRKTLEDIEGNQADSLTKSRYVTDGHYAMYVVLLPAPDGGAAVFTASCDMDVWSSNRDEYNPQDIMVQAYDAYEEALEVYWSWDL
jgi:hypothetical protein